LKKVELKVSGDFERVFGDLVKGIKDLVRGERVRYIGVGLPGVVDEENGVLVKSPNLGSWEGREVKKDLEKEFGCEVRVRNDTVMAGVGEAVFGYGKKVERFLYVNWGTGWGVVYLEKVGGQWRSRTMEAGHQIVEHEGKKCGCGQRGCLEAYVGGGNAVGNYGKKMEEILDEETWNKIVGKAGQGLLNTLVHFPVDLVVFGGGVVLNQRYLVGRLREVLEEKLKIYPLPEMKSSKLGEWVGVCGGVVSSKQ
jgi:predicted NBD/HSP70 family sugar kinase